MPKRRIFYGWYIVGACLLIQLYTVGIVDLGFTAVFEPIADEFGWSYAQISLAASIRGFEVGLLAPIMGILVDRWGPRRLILIGSLFLFIGFVLMSRVSSLAMFYGVFFLIAIGRSTGTQTVTMTAVGNWFRRRVGLAVGIAASGVGLGGFLVPVLTGVIDLIDWRNAMLFVGVGMLVILIPLSLFVRHKPEPYGYLPDGDGRITTETEQFITLESTEVSFSARQALKTRAFWNIALASMLFMFVSTASLTHLMPYFSTLGIARSFSSLVVLAVPGLSIVGRLGGGWLGDKINRKHLFTVALILTCISMFLFEYISPSKMWLVTPFVITAGLGWGFFATNRVALQREYFGRKSFGTILGFTSGIMMIGNLAGPPLIGLIFDTWGSYQNAWLGCGALAGAAIILSLTIPSYSQTHQHQD